LSLQLQRGARVPPAGLIERFYGPMRNVARVWLLVSRAVPVEITSWWRPESTANFSQHVLAAAMDGLSPRLSRAQLLPIVQRAAAQIGGVSVPSAASETSGRSVHVQGLPYGVVRTILAREPRILETASGFIGPARPVE
jgi:hypothetical protein